MTKKLNNREGDEPGLTLTPEQLRSRRARNIAIALAIAAFMLIFYVVTIVKLGSGAIPGRIR